MGPPQPSLMAEAPGMPTPRPPEENLTTVTTTADDNPGDTQRWLLLIYRIQAGSSSRRTYVWRQLRQLGAVYLQQAVAVLPDRPELRAGLDQLGGRIRVGGGEVSLLETASPSAAWEEDLVGRFNLARNAEYDEIIESVERFEDEIRRETRKKRFMFAEARGERDRLGEAPALVRAPDRTRLLRSPGSDRRRGCAGSRPRPARRVHRGGVPARGPRRGRTGRHREALTGAPPAFTPGAAARCAVRRRSLDSVEGSGSGGPEPGGY